MDDDIGFNITYIDNFLASIQTLTLPNLFDNILKLRALVIRLGNTYPGNKWDETKAEMLWPVYATLV